MEHSLCSLGHEKPQAQFDTNSAEMTMNMANNTMSSDSLCSRGNCQLGNLAKKGRVEKCISNPKCLTGPSMGFVAWDVDAVVA